MRFDATIPMFALCMAASCVLRTPSLVPSLSASASSFPSGSSAPAESPAPEVGGGGLIEAGCSFTGRDIKGEPGSRHPLACPARCKKDVPVWGTDVYTAGTPVCAAAIHAGMISERGGETTLVLESARPAFRGSKRNGITSQDWGKDDVSFRFDGPRVVQAEPEVRAPVVVDAGCTFEANQIHGEPGSIHRVSCPPHCTADLPPWGGAWGTDTYSGNSRICVAAIHAGMSSDEGGGEFTLILGDKRPAFRGSKRNGVESHDLGAQDVSFRLQR
ncbi:MAG TPA: LCCL domain-containing protein [Kofleriaceae bacterium]|nr:LCCL domain-containing protein [Kofleriaceae bacterium]